RVAGVVIALLLVGAVFALQSVLTGPLLAAALRRGLAEANGATVDVAHASLDLAAGKLQIQGLALADPAALDHDLFRAGELTADVSGLDLLRRRVHLEHVVVSEASQGAPRESRGSLVGWRIQAPPPAPPAGPAPERTLADYVKDYELWRDRLAQARQWLQRLAPDDAPAEAGAPGTPGAQETLGERLQREADESGYANVVARHLVEGAPTLLVSDLRVDGLTSAALPDEVLDVQGANLSTQPSLVDGAPQVTVKARSGHLLVDLGLGGLARRAEAGGATSGDAASHGAAGDGKSAHGAAGAAGGAGDRVLFRLHAFPVDRIAGQLRVGGEPPIAGGTLDVDLDGRWSGGVGRIDLPLSVTLHDSTMHLGGRDAKVSSFTLPIGLRGPLDDLAISIDDEHLVEALKAAGAAELSRRVDEEKAKLMEKAGDEVNEKLGDALDKAADKGLGDKLGGLLGGKKKEPKPKKDKQDG
ncbi:MAG TPA: hypothetical protein VK824_04155, partial [Planctomycetota bacterium]|nr:hypothetical protein [Planctomycetota bacterium]